MKEFYTIKYIVTFIAANLLAASVVYAQKPIISSFEPQKASFGEIITINGSGFTSTRTDLKVLFGSVEGKINESSPTAIRVTVPAGAAANKPISVMQKPSGLIAYTNKPFYLSFGGKEDEPVPFSAFKKYPGTAANIDDVCACDLDGDGKNDLVGSNPSGGTLINYLNTSNLGDLSFTSSPNINVGIPTLYISCGDLDGDGRPDLVLTVNGTQANKVMVLRNTSLPGMISFSSAIELLLPHGKKMGKPAILDLDMDGKAEIILSSQADNQVYVFKNTSTIGSIGFAPFLSFQATESFFTLGLRIKDLNNDGLPDISVSEMYGNNVSILYNNSSAGNISFNAAVSLNTQTNIQDFDFEDVDGDGKNDLILVDGYSAKVNIHLNTSTGSTLSFAAQPTTTLVTTGVARFMGLQIGDLNGDKKIDILLGDNNGAKTYLFVNKSAPGALSFHEIVLSDPTSTTGRFRHVYISDLDGDAKPDVIAADRPNGTLYTYRNEACIFPTINPSGAVNVCGGSSVNLSTIQTPEPSATAGPGAPRTTYKWFHNNIEVGSGPTFLAANAGSYYVKISSTDGCTGTSAPVTVNFFTESIGNPTFNPVAVSCEGLPLNLTVSPAVEGATYTWTNINTGFTRTTTANTLNIPQANPVEHSGVYKVKIVNRCQREVESPLITIHPVPEVEITSVGAPSVCAGESRTLQVPAGFAAYSWKKNGSIIPNKSSPSLDIQESGSYTAVVKTQNGCDRESAPYVLESQGTIHASFEAPQMACIGQPVSFTNTSSWASGKTVSYHWNFGDGTESLEQSPAHVYDQPPGTELSVTLTIRYNDSECSNSFTRSLTVTSTPEVTIEAQGPTEFCSGDSVKVQLSGDILAANWSNGSTGLFTYGKTSGILEAEIMTAAGCTTTKRLELSELEAPVLQVSADLMELGRGETTYLQASGGVSYIWEPAESLDDPTIANPLASPLSTTTYKVSATGENGCTTVAEITIVVDHTPRVEGPKLFVLATDAVWVVPTIEYYPELSLTILNKFGRQVYNASPYKNEWDGTERGQPLNDGVYYYVFKTREGKIVKTGSITLVR